MKALFITFALANRWANQLLFAELAKLSPEQLAHNVPALNFGSVLGIANHAVLGDRLWLFRFTGQGERLTSVATVPYPDLAGLLPARLVEDERIIAFADGLAPARFSETLRFSTLEGTPKALPFDLCVAHFFNHQTHHRGQLHALLGVHGRTCPDIDLMYSPAAQAAGKEYE